MDSRTLVVKDKGEMGVPQGKKRLAILVGGGPAPGINSAISAATIEAANSGLDVIGIYDGFEHLRQGRSDVTRPLAIADVSRIHFQGGSILRTSRANTTSDPEDLQRTIHALRQMEIDYLVMIGGDGTAAVALEMAQAAHGAFRIAQLPKTIDNDLPLPGGMPTFGYETARHVGAEAMLNFMEDARTTSRWFFVVVMGRVVGHLALGIGKASGATVTIIPEEFPQGHIRLHDICTVLEGAILKRRVMGRVHGSVVIAEGIAERLDPEELKSHGVEVEYDTAGHIRLGQIPLATILRREVQRRFAARGEHLQIVDVTLGYALRSAAPIPLDVDYTRTLGHGAVGFLLSKPTDERLRPGGLVCLQEGHLHFLPFLNLRNPITGHTSVRLVDLRSQHYHVARRYMIRLERRDMEDPQMLTMLAEAAAMTPKEFDKAFSPIIGIGAT